MFYCLELKAVWEKKMNCKKFKFLNILPPYTKQVRFIRTCLKFVLKAYFNLDFWADDKTV